MWLEASYPVGIRYTHRLFSAGSPPATLTPSALHRDGNIVITQRLCRLAGIAELARPAVLVKAERSRQRASHSSAAGDGTKRMALDVRS